MCDYDDFVASIDEFARQLIDVGLNSAYYISTANSSVYSTYQAGGRSSR
jgi:hypothetical protein